MFIENTANQNELVSLCDYDFRFLFFWVKLIIIAESRSTNKSDRKYFLMLLYLTTLFAYNFLQEPFDECRRGNLLLIKRYN